MTAENQVYHGVCPGDQGKNLNEILWHSNLVDWVLRLPGGS